MASRPTLLNSCASAATAREARFRIDAAPQAPRAVRVVPLDAGAIEVVLPFAGQPWRGARFLHRAGTPEPGDALDDLVLGADDGSSVLLSEELADADFVMMIATAGDGAAAASAIGAACALRGIMTAGVILTGTGTGTDAAVAALRPHARVLLVSRDTADVAELLSAIGA